MSGRLEEIDAELARLGVNDDVLKLRRDLAGSAEVDLATVDAHLSALGDETAGEFSAEATGEHSLGELWGATEMPPPGDVEITIDE